MRDRFIRYTSGWIPVSVLLLFTAAIVSGQAQANLPRQTRAAPPPAASDSVGFSNDQLGRMQSRPLVVDTILALLPYFGPGVETTISTDSNFVDAAQ